MVMREMPSVSESSETSTRPSRWMREMTCWRRSSMSMALPSMLSLPGFIGDSAHAEEVPAVRMGSRPALLSYAQEDFVFVHPVEDVPIDEHHDDSGDQRLGGYAEQ